MKEKKLLFVDTNVNLGGSLKGTVNLLSSLNKRGFITKACDIYGVNKKYLELLSNNNIDFTVILPNSDNYVLGGESVIKKSFRFIHQFPDFIRIVFRLRKCLKNEEFEYILVNNKKTLLPVVLGTIGIKTKIIIYHRVWVKENSVDAFYRFMMSVYCSNIISHAGASVSALRRILPKKNISYIPNSVEMKIKPKIKNNDIFTIILPASRPTKLKGYDCAIKAIKEYTTQYGKNVRLLLTGEVPLGHSQLFFQELTQLIKDFELDDVVEFTGWRDDILELIGRADLMILPTHTEGFPRVIIESMLLKTPVISTSVGGIPDALEDGITGYVIKVDDHKALACYIAEVQKNRVKTNEIVQTAYELAKKRFNLEVQTNSFISALEEK